MYRKIICLFILIICNIHLISATDPVKTNNKEAITESKERIVFVHVHSVLTDEINQQIRDMVKEICQHTVEEAIDLLDGNVLSINLNPNEETIEIMDQLKILTDDQLRILEMNMVDLLTLVHCKTEIDITIAWL